jgi:hypothetical protein
MPVTPRVPQPSLKLSLILLDLVGPPLPCVSGVELV